MDSGFASSRDAEILQKKNDYKYEYYLENKIKKLEAQLKEKDEKLDKAIAALDKVKYLEICNSESYCPAQIDFQMYEEINNKGE
jgi:hypothetical protein